MVANLPMTRALWLFAVWTHLPGSVSIDSNCGNIARCRREIDLERPCHPPLHACRRPERRGNQRADSNSLRQVRFGVHLPPFTHEFGFRFLVRGRSGGASGSEIYLPHSINMQRHPRSSLRPGDLGFLVMARRTIEQVRLVAKCTSSAIERKAWAGPQVACPGQKHGAYRRQAEAHLPFWSDMCNRFLQSWCDGNTHTYDDGPHPHDNRFRSVRYELLAKVVQQSAPPFLQLTLIRNRYSAFGGKLQFNCCILIVSTRPSRLKRRQLGAGIDYSIRRIRAVRSLAKLALNAPKCRAIGRHRHIATQRWRQRPIVAAQLRITAPHLPI